METNSPTTTPSSPPTYNKERVIEYLYNTEKEDKTEQFYNLAQKETIDNLNKLQAADVNKFVNVFKYPPKSVNTKGSSQTGFLWCDDKDVKWAQNVISSAYDGHSGGSMACACRWFEYALKEMKDE